MFDLRKLLDESANYKQRFVETDYGKILVRDMGGAARDKLRELSGTEQIKFALKNSLFSVDGNNLFSDAEFNQVYEYNYHFFESLVDDVLAVNGLGEREVAEIEKNFEAARSGGNG